MTIQQHKVSSKPLQHRMPICNVFYPSDSHVLALARITISAQELLLHTILSNTMGTFLTRRRLPGLSISWLCTSSTMFCWQVPNHVSTCPTLFSLSVPTCAMQASAMLAKTSSGTPSTGFTWVVKGWAMEQGYQLKFSKNTFVDKF